MLQLMRENFKGAAAVILVALFCIPFALVGIDALFISNPQAEPVATINEEEITRLELQKAIYLEKRQLLAQLGDRAAEMDLSDERLAPRALDQLIRRKLLVQLAEQHGLQVSPQQLNQVIVSLPQFQVDGKFDQQKYLQTIGTIGQSSSEYKQLVKTDMLLSQLVNGLADSAFVLPSEQQHINELLSQKRSIQVVTFVQEAEQAAVTVSDEELQQAYQDNLAQYVTEEKVSLRYIDLRLEDFIKPDAVSEEALKQAYDNLVSNFESSTERLPAHILIEPAEDDSHQSRIDAVKAKLAAGEDFADLAKAYSDDLGSRDNGGELDYTQGDVYPEAFEEALAKLQKGQVSDLVETDSGFHFIKLLEVQENNPPSFEEEQPRLRQELARSQGEEEFLNQLESLRDASYESDTLEELSASTGLQSQVTELFGRQGGKSAITTIPAVVKAAFSEEVLLDGQPSELMEISNAQAIIVQRAEHQPSRQLAFEEVESQVRQNLIQQKARQAAIAKGEAILAQLQAGSDIAASVEGQDVTELKDITRSNQDLPAEVVELAFSLHHAGQAAGVSAANGDYYVVKVQDINRDDLDEQPQLAQWLAQQQGQRTFTLVEASFRSLSEISSKQ